MQVLDIQNRTLQCHSDLIRLTHLEPLQQHYALSLCADLLLISPNAGVLAYVAKNVMLIDSVPVTVTSASHTSS